MDDIKALFDYINNPMTFNIGNHLIDLTAKAERQYAALKLVEGQKPPTNTGSPKLPPLEEVERYISRTLENPLAEYELHIVGSTWAYIERQLRAGA